MSRYQFGADSTFGTYAAVGTTYQVQPSSVVTFWTAQTGGSQITDLLNAALSPITSVTSNADGTMPVFYGPDGMVSMWAAGGGAERILVYSTYGVMGLPMWGGSAPGLTGATAATRYVGGTASGAPVSGTFAKGDFVVDQTGFVWVCTTAGSPGTWTKVGAPTPLTGLLGPNYPYPLTGITTSGSASFSNSNQGTIVAVRVPLTYTATHATYADAAGGGVLSFALFDTTQTVLPGSNQSFTAGTGSTLHTNSSITGFSIPAGDYYLWVAWTSGNTIRGWSDVTSVKLPAMVAAPSGTLATLPSSGFPSTISQQNPDAFPALMLW